MVDLLVVSALVLVSFGQRPGRITFDTKFDLTASPGRFLERSLQLWNPQTSFGELQNQAYGYLFPQGLFAWLAEVAGMPDWVAQRLWSALVMVLAYEGARRLHRALAADVAWGWGVVAGLAYALAPRFLGLVGVLSAEVLPTAVLPWVVLPLVLALRGRLTPRTAGLLSGLAALFMGGVNAVENLATLPLPALLLLFALGSSAGRRLAAWWALAIALASAWWMLPLLVLGRYSPPFLDYIETAAATTFPLGWTNVLRGADHWVAFLSVGGRPWWPGAYQLAWEPWLIAVTGVVAVVSLVGLLHPTMPLRAPLALSAVLGLCLMTVAHEGALPSPLSAPVRDLLDGPLAMLRNVHKVDPLVRLPMALGFAHAGVLLTGYLARRGGALRDHAAPVAVGALAVVLLASAQPALTGDLRKEGWTQVPQAWEEAADWLADNADGRRALVLPGSGFGQQLWGWTIDEPIQGVARSPWVTRSQVPLAPGATIRYLDGLEERVQDGRGSPHLADALARAGIRHVVVRRDLDLFASGAPGPARVDQALARSPGLTPVARFGRTGFGRRAMVVVLRVDREVPLVEAVERQDAVRLTGGPEDVVTALESGLLDARAPALVGTEESWGQAPDLVGDGYRRRERQFGRLQDSLSQTMAADEPYRLERAAHDYPGVPGVPRTRAAYTGITAVGASSSSGYADTLGPVRPELGPFAAVDGVSATYWRSAPLEDPVGQWLELRLDGRRPIPYVDLEVGVDSFSGLPVRRVRVETDEDEVDLAVDPQSGRVRAPLSGTAVDRVRITVLDVEGGSDTGVVAVREVRLPGLEVGRRIEIPDVGADAGTSFVLRAAPGRRACVSTRFGPSCEPDEERPGEEESGMLRSFTTTEAGSWRARGTVVARSTPETAQLLSPLEDLVQAEASSVLTDDPAVSGQFAVDRRVRRPWLAERGDLRPSLLLTWDGARTLSRLRVRPTLIPSRTPTTAVLEAPFGQRREVDLRPGSLGFFEPVVTDRVLVSFPVGEQPEGARVLPVGVGELRIKGLQRLKYTPDATSRTGAPCGLGPDLVVDGRTRPTRVDGTVGDVISGAPLRLTACGAPVRLEAGEHDLALRSTDRFAPARVVLAAQEAGGDDAAPATRAVEVREWGPTSRAVEVGPGGEALLRVPENVNDGWRATLDGTELTTSPVDGWQQGWVLPAGAGGDVRLEFTPDRTYRVSLLLGLVCALLLVVGAVTSGVLDRRRRPLAVAAVLPAGAATGPLVLPRRWGVVAVVGAAAVLGGAGLAAGCLLGAFLRERVRRWAGAALGLLTTVAAAGAIALDRAAVVEALDVLAAVAVGLFVMCLTERSPRR